LLRLADDEHVLLLTLHHIITDGWSMGVLVRELATLYAHGGQATALDPLPLQYADYAAWQRQQLESTALETQLAYWRERLTGAPPLLELTTDRPRPPVQSYCGATFHFELPANLTERIAVLCRQEEATPFMALLAAFQVVLARYSSQDDFCIGTPIANRTRAEVEGLIGFFVNTLVLRADLSSNPSFRDLLQRVKMAALGAYAHQDVPFETLVEQLQPQRNLSYNPLFQVMFVFQNTPAEQLRLPGLDMRVLPVESGVAKFDLTLIMEERPDGLHAALEYNTDLFDETTIARMADHFTTLLDHAITEPDTPIGGLQLLTEAERRQLLVEWNDTAAAFPADRCAHHLFEAHVARDPDAPALTFAGTTLSYGELNRRANQLAHFLRKRGVGPETLVGICIERSLEMIVAALGVLKAGGAYVPLDPTYPPERLAFMLEDAQPTVVLGSGGVGEWRSGGVGEWRSGGVGEWGSGEGVPRTTNHGGRWIDLNAEWWGIEREAETNPEVDVTPDNLAYVIYTSGSTGLPKGTLLQHRGLCNLTPAQRRAFGVGPGSRVLQFSPFSFDASVWELVMALGNGATLCLAPQETLASGPELLRLLRAERITIATLPPSLLAVLEPTALPELQTVVAAGEACSREIVAAWAPNRQFFNAYGPTETTVCATIYRCAADDPLPPPIGRPLPNFQLYVLDQHAQPVPIGVPGELHVGGVGVARGYLNRPELTAEQFIANPFADDGRRTTDDGRRADDGRRTTDHEPRTTDNGQRTTDHLQSPRLYKTGDLVRYRRDGNLEFLGRVDHQVKLRGFRIELGEIEAMLRRQPGVQDALVRMHTFAPGDQGLVAYIVDGGLGAGGWEQGTGNRDQGIGNRDQGSNDGQRTTDNEQQTTDNEQRTTDDGRQTTDDGQLATALRARLREQLPEYMVPVHYVVLEAWPLTPSGKIDRSALPAPERGQRGREQTYVAPRTPVEQTLTALCAELLGIERVGVYDNFFELGGHSLLATQFIARLRDTLQVEVSLRSLFECPTIADLALTVGQLTENGFTAQTPAITPLSRDMRRMKRSELSR
jgi:amino acid adenylation domain-containing protein